MVRLTIHPGRLVHYSAWCDVRDHLAAETRLAHDLVDRGDYLAEDLVPTTWRHPGDPRTYAIGWSIDPRAKRRPSATQYRWRRALDVIHEMAIEDHPLADCLAAAAKRFPATTALPGWTRAAERTYHGWRHWHCVVSQPRHVPDPTLATIHWPLSLPSSVVSLAPIQPTR